MALLSFDHHLLHECEWHKFEVVVVHTNDLDPLPVCKEHTPRSVGSSEENSATPQENPTYASLKHDVEDGDVDDEDIVKQLNEWFFPHTHNNKDGDTTSTNNLINDDNGVDTTTTTVDSSTVTNKFQFVFNASDPLGQEQQLYHYNNRLTGKFDGKEIQKMIKYYSSS